MRPFRSLIIAIALAVGSLGLYRWVQPPAVDPASSASGLTAPPAGPAVASAFGRSLAVSAHVAAKRLRVRPLTAGQRPAPQDSEFPWRSSNTTKTVDELRNDPRALVLRNALIDTRTGEPLPLPESLVAGPEPGFHIVQFAQEPDAGSRRRLEEQQLHVVSYLPVNAFLVKGSDESVERLALDADIASVSPWHPAFKLEPELLTQVIDGRPLEAGDRLMLSLTDPDAFPRLESLGVREVTRQRSPFGTLVTVDVPPDALLALAQSPEVHLIEKAHRRELLNDRSAYLLGSATDVTNTVSYRGLTGSNVVINVNDSGIDWAHPDLTTNRVFTVGSQTNLLTDRDGHGTHVAGTIAGSGVRSREIQGPAQGSVTNAQFRGHAPNAKLFILPIDLQTGPTISDAFLQEQAAMTNALISNNSWGYRGAYEYNSISASYDAASRDALPETSGEQPVLFVFAAGNSGQGGNNGVGGLRGSVTAPGNAKNVITVGALETKRNLTNAVVTDDEGHVIWAGGKQFREPSTNAELTTNLVLRASTDTDTEVANFSSRGNVGIGIEGSYGRFKPDVVAPGSQILSARSAQWKLEDEYDTNSVQYSLFDDLNRPVAPWYRFLSGTSMAAPAVSGLLAQIQEFWHRPGIKLPRYIEAAAYKALLINSARPSSDIYAPNFRSVMNYAGWGQPSLPRALDSGVRLTRADGAIVELAGFAGELTTGASQSLRLKLTTNEVSATGAFHFTLVWTDPPGNPAAGLKLVNDLDLIVSNTVTGEVFVGNDMARTGYTAGRPGTNAFEVVEVGVTNSIFDSVNNVERVVLEPPLASEYIIQVVARRVNVNALASREVQNLQNRTNIVQDFVVALSSDAATGNDIVATAEYVSGSSGGFGPIQPPAVSVVATNGIPVSASRVGAQSPLVGGAVGQAAQWHFFVFTNLFNPEAAAVTGLTNGQYVEFVISSAANLARPRGPGASGNRLRDRVLGPDLDLYMSTDPGLTNLQASALASAYRSTQQGFEERIEITNAPATGEVYYIGVKAEDQQGGEFELVIRSSDQPFHVQGANGYSLLMTPIGGGRSIPDGSPDAPGVVRYFGTGPSGITRNVTFIQSLGHDNFFDLQGTLLHAGYGVTINNRRSIRDYGTGLTQASGPVMGLYDDIPGLRFPGGQPSDGPSTTLLDFAGLGSMGSWNYLLQDDVLGNSGTLNSVQLQVQPQVLPAFEDRVFENVCVSPRGYDFRLRIVPPDASRLIIEVTNMVPANLPLEVYIRREAFPDPDNLEANDRVATLLGPGIISISVRDVPALQAGTYFVLFHNPSGVELCFDVAIYGERNLSSKFTRTIEGGSASLADVARTVTSVQVDDARPVSDVQVGVRVEHARVSDLALRLVTPGGASALLFENRGLTTTNGLGGVLVTSNYQHVALSLDRAGGVARIYFNGEVVAEQLVRLSASNSPTSFHLGSLGSANLPGSPIQLDDFGLWRRSIRETEIRKIYEEGTFGRAKATNLASAGLAALWPMDRFGLDTIAGQTISSVGATVAGQMNFGMRQPGTGTGAISTDSRIREIGNLPGITLEGWIKPVSGNERLVVGGWYDAAKKRTGPVLLIGQSAPWGNGPGSLSAVFQDEAGKPVMLSTRAGVFPSGAVITNRAFAIFGDSTNGVYTPIKFAQPPYLSRIVPQVLYSNDWETVTSGDFASGTNSLEGWIVMTNRVSILVGGREGQVLDLRNAAVERQFDLNIGQAYRLAFTSRKSPAAKTAVNAQVWVDGGFNLRVDSTPDWVTNTTSFVAKSSRTAVGFVATSPPNSATNFPSGLEIGQVWLDQDGAPLVYQPEEPLRPLMGQPGTGLWELQTTDARGGEVGLLLDWQLRFTFMPTNPPTFRLTNGIAFTTNIVGEDIRYFLVDVPLEAERATNTLINLSGGLLSMLYSASGLPDPTESDTVTVVSGLPAGRFSASTLDINLPPLLPRGQRYYLAVRGAGGTSSNEFSIQADFGVRITPLTNRVAIRVTNTAPILQEYYSYQVPASNVLGVTFTVSGATGDVDLYAIRAPKLPGVGQYDYASATPGTTNETLVIHLDSQPVPLAPGLWYLSVTNTTGIPGTSYTISAIEQRGRIQELKPGQSITASHPGTDEDFYYVTLPTDVSALRVRTRGATEDLVLSSRSRLPVPTATNFEYQSNKANSGDEDLLMTTNSTPVALAGGRWYFAVTSVDGLPTPYTISAELRLRDAVFQTLTNEIWFEAVATNGPVDLEFIYRNPGDVSAITFELDQLTGEADMTVSPDEPLPLSPVSFANTQPGTLSERVTVLAGRDLPSLGRDWYLRVRLPSTGVRFRIRASLNRPPVWTPVATRRVTEGLRLTFNLKATDPDPIPQPITYGLVEGPVGLTVSTNGVVTWIPSEAQGPSTNLVLVFASDGAISSTLQFVIIVAERNQPPVWINPGTRRVIEGLQLTYALKASDADLPVQTLSYTLVSGPEGLTVNTNGVMNWQPTEAQGPSTNRVSVSVSDGVVSVPQEFDVVVLESNRLPVWVTFVTTRRVAEGSPLTFTVQATDSDLPAQKLIYRLINGPTGLVVTTNGVVSWTPTEAQGPSTNRVRIGVADGVANISQEFDIIVVERNQPPVWTNPGTRRVTEGLQLTYALKASDADLPVQTLKFTLVSGPEGLTVNTNGVMNWQPTEAQGPSTNRVTVSVSDGVVSVPQEFDVVALESNRLPVWVTFITTRRVSEGSPLNFTVQATDSDLPAQKLIYRLINGPTGLVVTTNGVVSWTPTEAQGPSTNRVRIGVTDGVANISQEFDIIVVERNQPPVWTNPGTRRVTEGLQLTFTLKATDPDLPVQTLRYTLDQGPAGLKVATNGVLSWKPTEAQGPSTNRVTVRVSDGVVSVTQDFNIVVIDSPAGAAKLTLVQSSGGDFELHFVGPFGAQYILEQSVSANGPWLPVPTVQKPLTTTGATTVLKVALPATASTSFYRFVKP